jgi:putative transcriptional regulator
MKSFYSEFLYMIKGVCRQFVLSQEDLDRELGVSYDTVNHWKNGLSKPSKLARAQLDAFCERMQETRILTLPEDSRG